MMVVAKVLIHSQGNTAGSLKEAIDHYRPAMVFLISNPKTIVSKVKSWIDDGNPQVGKYSRDVEHCEIINIDPFNEDSVLQTVMAVQEAKAKAFALSAGRTLEFYAGLSGGTKLMVIGMALAAIQGNLTTYYVDKPIVSDRESGEYLFEITFMNQLMKTITWINSDKRHLENLKYLRAIHHRERAGLDSTSVKMDRNNIIGEISDEEMNCTVRTTERTISRQLKLLKSMGLVSSEDKNPMVWSSTSLGTFILSIYGVENDDSDPT
jgi:hypothetical protein